MRVVNNVQANDTSPSDAQLIQQQREQLEQQAQQLQEQEQQLAQVQRALLCLRAAWFVGSPVL